MILRRLIAWFRFERPLPPPVAPADREAAFDLAEFGRLLISGKPEDFKKMGRSAAHSNRAKPEAARQTSLPCPATFTRGLPCVGVASSVDGVNGRRSSHNGERDQRTART
jgi:hypothetical protein